MAYSDYGSFVFLNELRRKDKEDVGVFDTDESNLPSGARIFGNIIKNMKTGNDEWFNHSQHGVIGDGNIRVACYKQGFPTIYHWKEGDSKPTEITQEYIMSILGLDRDDTEYIEHYYSKEKSKEIYYFDYDYPPISFEYEGYKFTFESTENHDHYIATMVEPNGNEWECVYDYGYGAGITD